MKKDYKRCPRCGQKTSINSSTCSGCNLKFDRIENLSNIEAKKALKAKEKEKVLYVNTPPKDINMKKFYLLYVLLGFFGIYNIYIGKKKRGLYSLITVVAFMFLVVLSETLYQNGIDVSTLNYILVAPSGTFFVFGILIWFLDLIALFSHTFKYPGALTNDEYLKYLVKSKTLEENGKKRDVADKKIKKL